MHVLNHGIWQPSYYQGKKLAKIKMNKKKDENT
jgi:hypothetical protein